MERNENDTDLNEDESARQSKKTRPNWNMFRSPVYVKRTEQNIPQKTSQNHHPNKESCTQTSKTIIELAKLDPEFTTNTNCQPRSAYPLLQPDREYNYLSGPGKPLEVYYNYQNFCANRNLPMYMVPYGNNEPIMYHNINNGEHTDMAIRRNPILDNELPSNTENMRTVHHPTDREMGLINQRRIDGKKLGNRLLLKKSTSEINLSNNHNHASHDYYPEMIEPPAEPRQDKYKFDDSSNPIEGNMTTIYNRDADSTMCEEDTSNSRGTYNITSTSSMTNNGKILDKERYKLKHTPNCVQANMGTSNETWREQLLHDDDTNREHLTNEKVTNIDIWRSQMFKSSDKKSNLDCASTKDTVWRPNTSLDKINKDHKLPLDFVVGKKVELSSNNQLPIKQNISKPISKLSFDQNKFKSRSYIEPHSRNDSLSPKRRNRRNESKLSPRLEQEKDKRVLHFYKNKDMKNKQDSENTADKETCINKGDLTGKDQFSQYSGFHTKRSNSFMSPTLASEQKSLKQVVDSVKNLVGMTYKGRSVSPVSHPIQVEAAKIPYIDQSRTEVSPRFSKSEELCKVTAKTNLNHYQSDSSFVGSTASSDNGIFIILSHIKSPDWNYALKGLAELLDIGRNSDPETLYSFLTLANQKLLELLRSPRSHVCRTACQLAGHYFEVMKDTRRPEFDDMVNLLLYKTADSNKFIRQDANLALDCMVTHITTFHAIRALCAKGPTHRNPLVRCAAIRLLICAVVIAESTPLFNNPNHEHSRRRIILNLAHFLEDKNLETRKYAERLYKILSKESNFEFYLKKYLDRSKLDSFNRTIRYAKKT